MENSKNLSTIGFVALFLYIVVIVSLETVLFHHSFYVIFGTYLHWAVCIIGYCFLNYIKPGLNILVALCCAIALIFGHPVPLINL